LSDSQQIKKSNSYLSPHTIEHKKRPWTYGVGKSGVRQTYVLEAKHT